MKLVDRSVLEASWIEWPTDPDDIQPDKVFGLLDIAIEGTSSDECTTVKAARYAIAMADGFLNFRSDRTIDEVIDVSTQVTHSDDVQNEIIDLMTTHPDISPSQVAEHFLVSRIARYLFI